MFKPFMVRRLLFIVAALVIAGCGSDQDSFIFTTSQNSAGSEATRTVVVQSVLARQARTVGADIATLTFSAVDAAGVVVFGPVDETPQSTLTFQVPLTAREFRIAYRDSAGNVVGVYQAELPSGSDTFTIVDPDYVDLSAFVESLSVDPQNLVLEVSESRTLVVTATLSDDSTTDVSGLVTLTSSAPGVAGTEGAQITGNAAGAASVAVALFNKNTTVSVTVNDFLFGLLSTPDGTTPSDGLSQTMSISDDGRYAAFESSASNLGNPTGRPQALLLDRSTGDFKVLSNLSDGSPVDATADGVRISGNGRFVVFETLGDLVPEDTNGVRDIYLYDIQTSALELVSVNLSGTEAGNAKSEGYLVSISRDGRFVAFYSDATDLVADDSNGNTDVFLRDRQAGTTELISQATDGTQGNDYSYVYDDGISDDGRFVTFYSPATNLDASVTDSNGQIDAFVRDRVAGTTTLITRAFGTSMSADGLSYVTDLSADGDTLVIHSEASNLTEVSLSSTGQVYRFTLSTGVFELLTDDNNGGVLGGTNAEGSLSADGRFLLFVNLGSTEFDPAGNNQVVIRDLSTGEYRVVSATTGGAGGNGDSFAYNGAMTQNGRTIVFESDATDLEVQAVDTSSSQVYATVNPFL